MGARRTDTFGVGCNRGIYFAGEANGVSFPAAITGAIGPSSIPASAQTAGTVRPFGLMSDTSAETWFFNQDLEANLTPELLTHGVSA